MEQFTWIYKFPHIPFYIIYYASISLFHYVPNLFLLMLQYHYLFSICVFTSYKLVVFLIANPTNLNFLL